MSRNALGSTFVILVLGCVVAAHAAQRQPAPLVTTNDILCAPSNAIPMLAPLHTQAPSTIKMVQRLRQLNEGADPRTNPFLSDRRAKLMEQTFLGMTNLNLEQELTFRCKLGIELVQAGRTADALSQYQAVADSAARAGVQLLPKAQSQLRMLKAQAMLRLGEQENCLVNHNADSCIFPLGPNGYHHLPRGSRGAIEVLTEQLEQQPADLSARWLLNLAYMTLGEYPEKVPAQWQISPKVFASDGSLPRFPDIAAGLGLDFDGLAGSCILDDFDNDGLIDLVVSCWALDGQLRYFHNDGNGRFSERTQAAGLTGWSVD